MPRQSAIAGKIAPIIESFILSIDDLHAIIRHVSAIISSVDLVVLIAFGWLLVPSMRIIYSFVNGTTDKVNKENEDSFEKSYLYFVTDHLSQISRLALLVYACDCLVVAIGAVGYKSEVASDVFAKILYTSWLARRISSLKLYILKQILNRAPENCNKIKLLNRIIDGLVYSLLGVKILDYLSVETGLALGSIFAVGTTGGLVISLASQEIAKGIMCGVEMASSDRFYEGDNVHFGDGTQGYIVKMGFLRTRIRKYDSTVIDVPNSQLGGQRAINISRSKTCRILTTLRFEFKHVQCIPKTLEAIKEEIAKACPKLINDGTKPFRAMISSFEKDHVEACINCYFDLPPTGEDFWANREQMFLAIDRGVKKTEVEYYTPIYRIQD